MIELRKEVKKFQSNNGKPASLESGKPTNVERGEMYNIGQVVEDV